MNIQKMRSNQCKKAKETAVLRHLNTVEKNNTWVLDEQLRSILGGNIDKGVKIAILGSVGCFKTGFLNYLVAQMMHNRKRVELGLASVVFQSKEESCEELARGYKRGLEMNLGMIDNPRGYYRFREYRILSNKHGRKHHYFTSFISFPRDSSEVVENASISEPGWAKYTHTTIEVFNTQRDEQIEDMFRNPVVRNAHVAFGLRKVHDEAGVATIYLHVLKHRGKIGIDPTKSIKLDKVTTYYRHDL